MLNRIAFGTRRVFPPRYRGPGGVWGGGGEKEKEIKGICKQRKTNSLFKAIDAHCYSSDLKKTKLWRQDELLRFSVQRMALNKTTDSCFIC